MSRPEVNLPALRYKIVNFWREKVCGRYALESARQTSAGVEAFLDRVSADLDEALLLAGVRYNLEAQVDSGAKSPLADKKKSHNHCAPVTSTNRYVFYIQTTVSKT